jgi:hypothetical protein
LRFVAFPGELYVGPGATRRATGSHYTPQILTEPIVRYTLAPLIYANPDTREGLKAPREILDLKVADIAMGSGAFLVQAVRYLSEKLVDSWDNFEAKHPDIPITPYGEPSHAQDDEAILPESREERLLIARRLVVDHCIYGVDINPLAVEMAKLSLWLVTFSKDKPFTFVDHALKCGDSLLGVNLEQLKHWSLTDTDRQVSFSTVKVMEDLEKVIKLRRELQQIMVNDVEDTEYKALILQETEEILDWLKTACDLVIAPVLESTDRRCQQQLMAANQDAFVEYLSKNRDIASLKALVAKQIDGYKPFHFHIDFPEVFLRERGGFDAIIGNPPFKGGQHITGEFGVPYREYLVNIVGNGKRGSADLCAYFYLNSHEILAPDGKFGLLATNTIAQGDTREVGLDQIVNSGSVIYNAVPTMAWPGVAAVHVAKVHVSKGEYTFQKVLDEETVSYISTFLDASRFVGKPYRLKANENKSFQGSIVLGMGFVLMPKEAQTLINKEPRNKDVLFPYLNGEDLNSRPDQSPSRWVINFFDWPLKRTAEGRWEGATKQKQREWLRSGIVPPDYPGSVAADYPDCLAIVEEKVKPERMVNNDSGAREKWWLFLRPRLELYSTISGMERVLLSCRITRNILHTFLKPDKVFDVATNVIIDVKLYPIVDSTIYYCWVRQFASTLKSDIRYTLTDCFETFPFPKIINALEGIGKNYYIHRQSIMQFRQEGLTETYNRFHDPNEIAEDIQKLRDLHVEIDYAVARAYGWNDLELNHDFYVVSSTLNRYGDRVKEIRFTVSPEAREEILARLLKLNHERYAEEVRQGLHGKVKKGKYRGRKRELNKDQLRFA